MKIYFPLNLNFPPSETKFYGWIDEETNDIFISSFCKPKWFPEFNDVEMEECEELGILSSNPMMIFSNQSESSATIQLPNSNHFINLNDKITNKKDNNLVLICYKIQKELSKSADFSIQFSSFPLKQIKWASILNCNEDGHFLKLTQTQKFLSTSLTSFLSLKFIKRLLIFAQQNSLRPFSINSSCLDQLFKKNDHFTELYKYLLFNESVSSDHNRNQYRNNLILTASDLIFSSILLPHLIILTFPWIKDHFYKNFTIQFFEDYLDWFMGWPAGFKFNANLTKFFGKFFLSLLAVWKEIDGTSADFLCNFKHFGLTFIFGFISDFFSISTLHILLFYRLMTKIYRVYCFLMVSLFRLFRGKKWNVLRKRVDTTEYTMDQLLVGMLLFSMLFCTFSTVTAYYLLFTASIVFISSVKCLLESLTIIMNSFPIYFLFLKTFNNPIITERFRLIPYDLKTRTPSFILTLEAPKNSEIFSDLFSQLIDCWRQVYNLGNIYNIIAGYPIK